MTDDHDFKKLVRDRMARTGESYTTARANLLRGEDDDQRAPAREPAGPRDGTGESGAEPSAPAEHRLAAPGAAQENIDRLQARTKAVFEDSAVVFGDRSLVVRLGASFRVEVPYERIRRVQPVPDKRPGSSLGAHGFRGRWLINAAYTGLVQLDITPAVRGELQIMSSLPDGAQLPRLLRPFLKDRQPKVRELTISVEDRESFLAELDERRRAAATA